MNKFILQKKPYEEIEYEYSEWITMLYNNWPLSGKQVGTDDNTRLQKKNAGEISISFFAYILAYYYPELSCITLLTFDKDCYNCVYHAIDKFNRNNNFKNMRHASITFKSNDLIFYELVNSSKYNISYIETIIDVVRTARNIKYTRRRADNSYEDIYMNVENAEFIELLKDDNVHIVF